MHYETPTHAKSGPLAIHKAIRNIDKHIAALAKKVSKIIGKKLLRHNMTVKKCDNTRR